MNEQTTGDAGTAVYPPSDDIIRNAHVDSARYEEMYARSVSDPEGFWAEAAQRLDWMKAP
ncbi:MAG TPA: acetyl-coenzyme A synthetase N-terminal domain-containing protein, partial [Roseovarius sp.]|nr:acetyl-coenzyme A synthetase N-terminal domain-containing protein [Roseovarius sp.]